MAPTPTKAQAQAEADAIWAHLREQYASSMRAKIAAQLSAEVLEGVDILMESEDVATQAKSEIVKQLMQGKVPRGGYRTLHEAPPQPVKPTPDEVKAAIGKTWFELEDGDDDDGGHRTARQLHWSSREHGDITRGKAGARDIAEAKRLQKLLSERFGARTAVYTNITDEWVSVIIETEPAKPAPAPAPGSPKPPPKAPVQPPPKAPAPAPAPAVVMSQAEILAAIRASFPAYVRELCAKAA